MKTISAGLKTAIENGTVATFIKLTRKNGVVEGFTNHDRELTIDTVLYRPAPGIDRTTMHLRNNAEVGNQEFTGSWVFDLDESDLTNGVYDDAKIDVYRADWTDVSNGTMIIFRGNLGLIQYTEDGFRADIHSLMKQLQTKIGMTFTSKCRHQLFSVNSETHVGACQVNSAALENGLVVDVPTNKLKFTHLGATQVDEYYANGQLIWDSGLNIGISYAIKNYTESSALIELYLPTLFSISAGDVFIISPGCDKTLTTCKTKFNNVVNYGGFPHIKPEVNWK